MLERRSQCSSWLGAAAVAAVIAAASARAEYNPFAVEPSYFADRVRVVALRPVRFANKLDDRERVSATIEELVTRELEAAGLEVFPPAVFAKAWGTVSRELGGTFDTHTGGGLDEKWEVARDLVFRQLSSERGVDATVTLVLSEQEQPVHFSQDGTARPLFQGRKLFWKGRTLFTAPQRLVTAFLSLSIHDSGGADLYSIGTAIDWTEIYVNEDHARRASSAALSRVRLEEAVQRLLAPLHSPVAEDSEPEG